MWVIILKSIFALISIFTGGAIFYKYIKDNKLLVFFAGSISILSAVYLSSEVKRDITKFNQDKWITPSRNVCESNGGKWTLNGGCTANWENAKGICHISGGRLPTIAELKKVVIDCGGIYTVLGDKDFSNITNKNMANESYWSCFENKGFTSTLYVSSTTDKLDLSHVRFVFFYGGDESQCSKIGELGVRCIRGI